MARPVLVPAGGRAAAQSGRLAVRASLLAALAGARRRRRMERVRVARAHRRRPRDVRVAAGARASAWARRSWAGSRSRSPRTGSSRPRPATCWRRSLHCLPAVAVDVRASSPRVALVARAVRLRDRLHPRLRPGASRARRRAVLPRLRARSDARALAGRRRGRRRGPRGRRWRARVAGHDRRLDRRGRPLAAPGRALLRRLARLRRPARPPRLGDLRLPRLADTARGDRRARHPRAPPFVRARGRIRRGDARPRHARARHDDADLRGRALRRSGRSATRASRSGCMPIACLAHRGARRLCGGRTREGGSAAAVSAIQATSSRASPSSSCSPTSA